ncbi:transcriptional regulator [Pseudomonas sp. GW704-F3]|nr:transcriptional regulator [Pseudomonas sp. GW704-F3]PMU94658.1 transcriptional regulator [Pseudomonas sp. GW704-F5]PMV00351.1 transcriptional regulator [Pseudomonas sp. MPBD4-3]PMV29839.1 transcriptional regulator [Pseudomonas sp. GW704-F2]
MCGYLCSLRQNAKCHVIFCDKNALEQRLHYCDFLARPFLPEATSDAGTAIPGSGGCRKVRWSLEGRGKSGSVRIIYTTQLSCGAVVALLIYGKGATEPIPAHILYKIAKDMNHATH